MNETFLYVFIRIGLVCVDVGMRVCSYNYMYCMYVFTSQFHECTHVGFICMMQAWDFVWGDWAMPVGIGELTEGALTQVVSQGNEEADTCLLPNSSFRFFMIQNVKNH